MWTTNRRVIWGTDLYLSVTGSNTLPANPYAR
jgi:hypothetical protein